MRVRQVGRWASLAGLTLGVQSNPPSSRLPAPDAALEADFTRIVAVRELADGRVLVTDAGEKKLLVVDFGRDAVARIGREGQGPGEYRGVGQLYALDGDSTLMVDVMGGRWLLLRGAEVVQTVGADAPALREGGRIPSGASAHGDVLATRAMGIVPGTSPAAMPERMDSTYLVRIARATGRTDTVATLRARPARINIQGPRERPTAINITTNPLAAGDLAVMFPDGSVAIARSRPYRVDHVGPDGRLLTGAPLPFTPIEVTTREKEAVMRRNADASGRPAGSPESMPDWPEELPPFLPGALLPAPEGRVWILRTRSASEPGTRYDVVDGTGRLAARYALPAGELVIGFGRGVAYSVLIDDDGLQHLRRHRLG